MKLGAGRIHLLPLFQLRMRQHHGIGALVVEQRIAPAVLVGHHLANHDPVVTPLDDLVPLALEAGGGAFQQNGASDARPVRHARIAIIPGAGKLVGQRDLADGQHVDGEVRGLRKDRVAARALVDAPEDERRIERHGIEAVGGDPDLPAIGTGRHDRDAGGEVAQRPTEFPGVNHGLRGRGQRYASPSMLRRAGSLSVALAIFPAILRGDNGLCCGVCRHVLSISRRAMGRHGESPPGSVSKARGDTPQTRWGGKQAGLPAPTITRQARKAMDSARGAPGVVVAPGNGRAGWSAWPPSPDKIHRELSP